MKFKVVFKNGNYIEVEAEGELSINFSLDTDLIKSIESEGLDSVATYKKESEKDGKV